MEITNIFTVIISYFKSKLFRLSPKSILGEQAKFDSLAIFSLMLSIGVLLDNITFGIEPLRKGKFLAWMVIFSLFLIWIRPQSILILLFSLTVQNIYAFEKMPLIPNHSLFEFIINLGFILAILLIGLKDFPIIDEKLRSNVYLIFVVLGKISLIFLYFFSVLHKLNYDFFSQNHGCSVELLLAIHERFFSFEPPTLLLLGSGWLTIIVETIIPIFLCFRSTRLLGIIIGCCFHFILAWHPIQVITGFSALIYSLFFLFVSPIYTHKHPLKVLVKIRWVGLILILNLVLISVFMKRWSTVTIQSFFVLWFIGVTVFLVREAIQSENIGASQFSPKKVLFIKLFLTFLVSLVLTINGMTSYLGLKTHTNLSMFSNLQTENRRTNHFFIPQTLKLFDFQDDLVEIINTNVKSLESFVDKDNILMTYFEFQRIINNQRRDFFVRYLRNGKEYYLRVDDGHVNNPDLFEPNHWLLNKFMSFRRVHEDYSPCQW